MFLGGSAGKESACNGGDLGSMPGLRKIPWRKEMAIHSGILAWKIPWAEELDGLAVHGVTKSRT